jgi:hypothetical protein
MSPRDLPKQTSQSARRENLPIKNQFNRSKYFLGFNHLRRAARVGGVSVARNLRANHREIRFETISSETLCGNGCGTAARGPC